MTTEVPGDAPLEERVANLELEVGRLRERVLATESGLSTAAADSSATRTLAAGADRDVSEVRAELRAHLQALNALRETQREMGHQIRELDQRMERGFAAVNAEFAVVGANFATVEANFATVEANFATVETKFATVKAGIDEIAELLRGREERG